MNETEVNLWAAFELLEPQVIHPIFYRLYYDQHGAPIVYTMEDLPGNYVEVDQQMYVLAPGNVRVQQGKVTYIETRKFHKLVPSEHGTCCSPNNVAVVVNSTESHVKWSMN